MTRNKVHKNPITQNDQDTERFNELRLRQLTDTLSPAEQTELDYLVSDNTKDFPPKKQFAGITMITSAAFLRLLES